jgi:hypothetical protein
VDTGSLEENASKQESGASVLILSEPIMLWARALVIGTFRRSKPAAWAGFMSKKQHNRSNRCLKLRPE